MVAPISNNISTGISPLVSNYNSAQDHVRSSRHDLSTTSNDYTREVSTSLASQSATALDTKKGDIQYSAPRTEKAFEERESEGELPNKNNKKKSKKDNEYKSLDINI